MFNDVACNAGAQEFSCLRVDDKHLTTLGHGGDGGDFSVGGYFIFDGDDYDGAFLMVVVKNYEIELWVT